MFRPAFQLSSNQLSNKRCNGKILSSPTMERSFALRFTCSRQISPGFQNLPGFFLIFGGHQDNGSGTPHAGCSKDLFFP